RAARRDRDLREAGLLEQSLQRRRRIAKIIVGSEMVASLKRHGEHHLPADFQHSSAFSQKSSIIKHMLQNLSMQQSVERCVGTGENLAGIYNNSLLDTHVEVVLRIALIDAQIAAAGRNETAIRLVATADFQQISAALAQPSLHVATNRADLQVC